MASPCDTLDIVPRVSWGARNAKPGLDKAVLPLDMMVYTHTHGPSCSDRHACAAIVREVQAFHMDRKASPFSDIGYSFLIGSDGSIFEGRGWAIRPAYDLRYNGKGFGTAFIGRYASKDNASTPFTHHAAISAHDLLKCAQEKGYVKAGPFNQTAEVTRIDPAIKYYIENPQTVRDITIAPHSSTPSLITGRSLRSVAEPVGAQSTLSTAALTGLATGVIGLILLVAIALYRFCSKSLISNPDDHRDDMQKLVPASTMSYYERESWAVDLTDKPEDRISEGQSGIVVKGWLIPRNRGKLLDRTLSQRLPVAVKMLREAHPDHRSIAGFLTEMSILMKVGRHVNIVNLEGVVLRGRLKIVMEYCELGALDGFLRKLKGATTAESKEVVRLVNGYVAFEKNQDNQLVATPDVTELICIAHQISRGMAFLSEKNIIHRDLAARNIVLTVDRIVKICDFGMAREQPQYVLERDKVPLPVCWMAPESMVPGHGVFSTQSDVWSFGVVLWEIFTLGDVPYTTEFSHGIFYDVLYGFLRSGGRLRIPSLCPESVAVMMLECWDFTAENRPTFELLHQKLEQLLPVALRNRYVIFDADNNKINETLEITATEIDMDGNIAELVSDD